MDVVLQQSTVLRATGVGRMAALLARKWPWRKRIWGGVVHLVGVDRLRMGLALQPGDRLVSRMRPAISRYVYASGNIGNAACAY